MFSSTVLIYEFFAGGGCFGKDVPSGLASEAIGMLWSILVDFRLWGKVRTLTALDPRFENLVPGLNQKTLPADHVFSATAGYRENFEKLLKSCDAVHIIAPETDGILSFLTEQAESAGLPVLGSSSTATTIAGNKGLCHQIFQNANLPTPRTLCARFESYAGAIAEMEFPLVLKPLDGVGSEGVCCIRRIEDLDAALETVRKTTARQEFLVQSFAEGSHVSVSVLASGDACLPICVNQQLMETECPFRYLGSRVPFPTPMASDIMELAGSAVRAIPGLKGYVGVDLVCSRDRVQLIEINPRLTTSYLGLRQVSKTNIVQSIWEACLYDTLPPEISVHGEAVIRKDQYATWGLVDWLKQQ